MNFFSVNCNDFIVLSSPKSIVFKGSSTLPANALSEIYAASLGYSINSNAPWDGLRVDNPFNVAKSVISVVVEDAEGLNFEVSRSRLINKFIINCFCGFRRAKFFQ